ncbi:MAG: hypothetical protein ACREFE_19045, partial [Limisphaerales bacterium]
MFKRVVVSAIATRSPRLNRKLEMEFMEAKMTGLIIREKNGAETCNGKFSRNNGSVCVADRIFIRPYER